MQDLMVDFSQIGAAVIGTGFIGTVHIGALRRLGVPIIGVLGSTPEQGTIRAAKLGVAKSYGSLEQLLTDPDVQVVHVTSPNHLHYPQVKQILAAGRHIVCEKPLAMNADQSFEMVQLSKSSSSVTAVCYNTRFYALNQHASRMVANGELGEVRLITGHYHQDWLAKDSDWNWRLETEAGGPLRSVGDIGTHWMDLASFVTGLRPQAVMAELATFIPLRQKPTGPVETFVKAGGHGRDQKITTDDAAIILMKFSNGARGVMSTSQVSHGHKNDLQWNIAGSAATAAWRSEAPDQLWIGHRDQPNQILLRDPALMNTLGSAATTLPAGHIEGFADSFFALFRQIYGDVTSKKRSPTSTYASFEDGHHQMLFCDAVLKSAKAGAWVNVGDML